MLFAVLTTRHTQNTQNNCVISVFFVVSMIAVRSYDAVTG